jgi:Flp pilus assembly protein TadG
MKRISSKLFDDCGNVLIEYTLTAVAMFIPISYMAIAAADVAAGYIEVQDAARTAARVMATSSSDYLGKIEAREIANQLTSNSAQVSVQITCSHNPCLVDEEIVTVAIEKIIPLSLPGFTGFGSVTVRGVQAEIVQEV